MILFVCVSGALKFCNFREFCRSANKCLNVPPWAGLYWRSHLVIYLCVIVLCDWLKKPVPVNSPENNMKVQWDLYSGNTLGTKARVP